MDSKNQPGQDQGERRSLRCEIQKALSLGVMLVRGWHRLLPYVLYPRCLGRLTLVPALLLAHSRYSMLLLQKLQSGCNLPGQTRRVI